MSEAAKSVVWKMLQFALPHGPYKYAEWAQYYERLIDDEFAKEKTATCCKCGRRLPVPDICEDCAYGEFSKETNGRISHADDVVQPDHFAIHRRD